MCHRGEIYLVDFGTRSGSLQQGKRPALLLSNNKNNEYSSVIQVAPLSTRINKQLPVHVFIPKEIGLSLDSIVMLEQETCINKVDLLFKIADCPIEIMNKVDDAILIQKGIKIKTIENIKPVNPVDTEHMDDLIWLINDATDKVIRFNNKFYERVREILIKELKYYCNSCGLDFINVEKKVRAIPSKQYNIYNNVSKLACI